MISDSISCSTGSKGPGAGSTTGDNRDGFVCSSGSNSVSGLVLNKIVII